jgi:hypothetical protein
MSFDKYLDPTLHVEMTGSGERRWYMNKKGQMALVWNWGNSGKWKIMLDLDQPMLRAYKYTKQLFDSFEDACRVYDLLCATNGLTSAAKR